jgi:Lrp/AsnC family leucine-responsive transcriptional regulator
MKRLRYQTAGIDATDVAIVRALSEDARVTMADLAKTVGLSAPSVTERVRRLEEAGVVRGYSATIDPSALGLPIAAYIRVRPLPGQLRKVAEVLAGLEAVVECDRVTGEDCFIAKAHVRSIEQLEVVIDAIMPYAMTNTSVIQSSPVKPRLPPLPRTSSATA